MKKLGEWSEGLNLPISRSIFGIGSGNKQVSLFNSDGMKVEFAHGHIYLKDV
jgi:hypothetical protein